MIETEQLVCQRIKTIRNARGMTLKELGAKTNLSVSFLSQVERGLSSMTLTSLRKISRALEVPMKDIVSVEDSNDYTNRTDAQMIMRLGKNFKGFVRLSGRFPDRVLDCFLLVLNPHDINMELSSHEGEEFYFVTKGRALFVVGDEQYVINEGESIHYPSSFLHRVENHGDTELCMICAITPSIF